MIDLQIKFALAAAIAALATRRITPANAAAAHRLWLMVVLSPALWLAGELLFSPVAYGRVREDLLPAVLVSPSAGLLAGALAIHVVITVALLVRVLRGVQGVRRLSKGAKPLAGAEVARLRDALGEHPLDVREGSLPVPVTAGFFRPIVLLPAGWRALSGPALEAILRHETAHVRRRDGAVALLCAVMEALFWFNPAAWIAGRQVRWFAEMACDAEAASGMSGEQYASELLRLAAAWRGVRRPLYALTAGAETNVACRVRLLLDELERGWRRRIVLPLAVVCLLVMMPVAATFRIGAASAATPEKTLRDHSSHATVHQLGHGHR